jgi:hypothetical protein
MNAELIKQYKPEFDHQLYGGKLQHRDEFGEWHSTRDIWDSKDGQITAVVVDDEYLPFRKALAEGKTVQYNFGNHGINRKDFPDSWKDLDQSIGILADRACPENYRIKPNEPKFKVGDWVQHIELSSTYGSHILKIEEIDERNKSLGFVSLIGQGKTLHSNLAKLWKPEPDDYCWFWDLSKQTPILGQYAEFENRIARKACEYLELKTYSYCEPFIGTLPSNLQN